jgi:hypothetical protein
LLATDAVLIDGSSETLAKQAGVAGAKILIMTGSADRIVELDGAGRPYLSKPFTPEAFLGAGAGNSSFGSEKVAAEISPMSPTGSPASIGRGAYALEKFGGCSSQMPKPHRAHH